MNFHILETDKKSKARLGLLSLPHGDFETPFFMPVASRATVKTLDPSEVPLSQVIISNALLMHLRPGEGAIRKLGGLHRYMGWQGGIFCDSGGFQLIRRGFEPKVKPEGVIFKSPFDGKSELVTPEAVLDINDALGSDVAMALDHCPPYPSKPEDITKSASTTLDWAQRSIAHGRDSGLSFGIVQGGTDPALRKSHGKKMAKLEFDGFGVGGLSIGESHEEMYSSLAASLSALPVKKPRYFMGLGTTKDILRAVSMGVDVFDSVYPTRNARHKSALTPVGTMNLGKERYKEADGPVYEGCECPTCQRFSLGYVNNLLRDDELLGLRLLSIHNVHYVQSVVAGIREAIREGKFPRLLKANGIKPVK